jgi:hypothetical protein
MPKAKYEARCPDCDRHLLPSRLDGENGSMHTACSCGWRGEVEVKQIQKESAGLSRRPKPKPREGPMTPEAWRRAAFDLARVDGRGPALCVVTGEPLSWEFDEVHHPLEKRLLRARGLYLVVWDPRNSLAVKKRIHLAHTAGDPKIARSFLPARVWEFAAELGEWATARIEDDHPEVPQRVAGQRR